MINEDFIKSLGVMIVAGGGIVLVARQLKIPNIVAFLMAGLVLGPLTGWVELTESVDLISEAGIILLLFLVGMELNLEKIRDVGKTALWAGSGQVVLTAVGGFFLCRILGFGVSDSVFLGIAVTFSSTVIVVKLLDEKRELDSLYGRIAVGIFLVQDLVVIVLLTILGSVNAAESMRLGPMLWSLVRAFSGMAGLIAAMLVASRYLLPGPFRWASRSSETLLIWSLCWCFLVVAVAHGLHLSPETGAFLAGLSLAQLPYNHDLRRRVHPLMNFFIAVFFVSLGIKMQLDAASFRITHTVSLVLYVLLGKLVILMGIITRMGYGRRTAFLSSITVAQISEFSFILGAMGLNAGFLSEGALSLMGIVGTLTMAISAFLILYNRQLAAGAERMGVLRWFGRVEEGMGAKLEEGISGHVIVVGMNTLGRELVRRLCHRGEQVLAVDTDPQKLAGLPCSTLLGNVEYLSVLEEAGLKRAKLLISALLIEDTNDLLAYRCRKEGIPCSINVLDLSVVDNLLEMDVTYLMIPKVDGIKFQKEELKRRGFITE